MSNSARSEYAKAGVDYTLLEPFKQAMISMGKRTVSFPNRRGVFINEEVLHSHGAVFEYRGTQPHLWCSTQEGLGNKSWIAEWMYQNSGTGRTFYEGIAVDAALMAVNDVIAQGAMPVVFTDEVAVGESSWFANEQRSHDLALGYYNICKEVGMALPAGESPALRYLLRAEPPITSAPSLSGCVTGIVAPKNRLITGKDLAAGTIIIGAPSSGVHANGISLVIKKILNLPEQFLTKMLSGRTVGEEILTPTRSYVALIEALLNANIRIRALLPGTGDGVGKLAFDKRNFTYRIHSWPKVPAIFEFLVETGIPLKECLKTFNWGIGYYLFVDPKEVEKVLQIGKKEGYELVEVGIVEEGKRQVIFEPESLTLPPPGE